MYTIAIYVHDTAGKVSNETLLAGVEGEFQEGYELDAKTAKKLPKAQIGKPPPVRTAALL